MPPRFQLILAFLSGQLKGQRAQMTGDRMVVGSADYCDLQLTDPGVSRQHAVIRYVGQKYVIADLGSRNGVFVNGQRLSAPHPLYHKDKVMLGSVQIRIRIPGTQAPAVSYDPEKLDISASSERPSTRLFNKRVVIYGGVGLVLVGLFVLLQGPEPGEKKRDTADTEAKSDQSEAEIKREITQRQAKLAELLAEEAEKEREVIERALQSGQKVTEPEQHRLAREKFERAMRELRAKHFIQAEREFNLALALNPRDPLISEYLTRTRRKRRSVAVEHYELGKAYFASLRYDLAASHFHKVLELLEIEKKNLDNESNGYVEIMKNVESYLKQITLEERK